MVLQVVLSKTFSSRAGRAQVARRVAPRVARAARAAGALARAAAGERSRTAQTRQRRCNDTPIELAAQSA